MTTEQTDIDKLALTIVEDMLCLEPDSESFHVHFVDTDTMGILLLEHQIIPEVDRNAVIGIGSARVRHKIAYTLGLSIDQFSFIVDNKSDLEVVIPEQTNLILWDYLQLSQPLANNLVYRNWKRIDLMIIVPELCESQPGTNLGLISKQGMPSH